MNISDQGLKLLQQFEGIMVNAYPDSGGVWTIGYGTTKYPNGKPVKQGDICSLQDALEWLKFDVQIAVNTINRIAWGKPLNQAQFDSLVSFQYNCGGLTQKDCALRDKAKIDPDDETIYKYDKDNPTRTCEFTRWVKVNGQDNKGLLNRRIAEADMYGGSK